MKECCCNTIKCCRANPCPKPATIFVQTKSDEFVHSRVVIINNNEAYFCEDCIKIVLKAKLEGILQ